MESIDIKKIEQKYIQQISNIHREMIPDDFCSCLGGAFLSNILYPFFLSQEKSVGYVAVEGEQVIGFIMAGPASRIYLRLFKRRGFILLKYIFFAILKNPFFVKYIIEVCYLLFHRQSFKAQKKDAELLYIAILKKYQGCSLGSQLIHCLMRDLEQLGYERCIVKTLLSTQDTGRFYEKNGFSNIHRMMGRIWYSIQIDGASR